MTLMMTRIRNLQAELTVSEMEIRLKYIWHGICRSDNKPPPPNVIDLMKMMFIRPLLG